jgi:large subunit ribosomal protein L3
VVKGMRAAGRMGGGRVTIHNLKVVRVDAENHLLLVEGGIPGAPESYVIVRKAVTAKRLKVAQVEKPKKGKK